MTVIPLPYEEIDLKPPWAAGTIVYLKSGSPPLTISDMTPYPYLSVIQVEWFAGDEVRRDSFHKDCLTTVLPKVTGNFYG